MQEKLVFFCFGMAVLLFVLSFADIMMDKVIKTK